MSESYNVKIEHNLPIMLRDGTMTYADVYRPDSPGAFPALLQRTPYDKSAPTTRASTIDPVYAASRGYAAVVQDVRGRYSSEGEFYTFVNESDDGHVSIDSVASQRWCSGKVGMWGSSYVGATQWLAAMSKPSALAAIVPGVTASDYHEGWTWQGGAFELGFNLSWATLSLATSNWEHLASRLRLPQDRLNNLIDSRDGLCEHFRKLPLSDLEHLKDELAPYYYDWLEHPEFDDYWRRVCIEEHHSDISVPALSFGGWYDIFLGGTIRNYTGMRDNGGSDSARRGQRLVIGPWIHGGAPTHIAGDVDFGLRAGSGPFGLQERAFRFYDHYLKGEDNGLMDEKPVQIFVMGINQWRGEDDWPLERADDVKYYLHSAGKANTLNGNGRLSPESPGHEPPDTYVYNPIDPAPTAGGGLCCDPGNVAPGAFDHRAIETREDVLVYSTPPLPEDVEVTGHISVTLFASSSAVDTDFTAKLLDVSECGFARNLTDGIIRARYRTPRTPASFLEAGRVYKYSIDLWATSNVFRKGHQIRLEISSSNFPRFDRNLNTGESIAAGAHFVPALQTVLHSSEHPSHVTLPVVPAG